MPLGTPTKSAARVGGRYPFTSGTGAVSGVPSCGCAGGGAGCGRKILVASLRVTVVRIR